MPFAGCPNRCSFCDQHSITGVIKPTTPKNVKETIEIALSCKNLDTENSEIAFFGGSFTAIDRNYMISLLEATKCYHSKFKGIRISTRPDCINEEILIILKNYGVTAIELGAQSMCDDVLLKNDRGHNSDCVRNACELIKEKKFSLGLQMMTGLYGSSYEKDVFTAQEFIKLMPDTVRIYPTVILKNTKLENLVLNGEYIPDSLEQSVNLCSELIKMFEYNNISVIRVGLHSSETMEDSIVSGAYHPAFKELCENKIFFDFILKNILDNNIKKGNIRILANKTAISKIIGQRKSNLNKLKELGFNATVAEKVGLSGREIIIQEG